MSTAAALTRRYDAVVVGAGLAGLSAALALRPARVLLVAAGPMDQAASSLAQGGIAAAFDPADDASAHAADTLAAGAGLCDPRIVSLVTAAAPAAIGRLVDHGVAFDRDDAGRLALGREAAHGRARIVHAGGDGTGFAVTAALTRAAAAADHITWIAASAAALWTRNDDVVGLVLRRGEATEAIRAGAVVLATGGIGALYAETTNPTAARGSGLALAARAGAALTDLEFVQFHPTAIAAGGDPLPLATEALRGAGARLVDETGTPIMEGIDPALDLAPRDVVARAVYGARRRGRTVFLDTRTAIGDRLPALFPTVASLCRRAGIDPLRQPIPVAPAAHYHMGGIAVDRHGRSSLKGLWACGEVAGTGLHGANRLASNSLLEALVYGERVAHDILGRAGDRAAAGKAPKTVPARPAPSPRLRRLMSDQVGVVRHAAGLDAALTVLAGQAPDDDDALVARLIAYAARARRESRGAHCRADYPLAATARRFTFTLAEAMADIAADPALPSRARA